MVVKVIQHGRASSRLVFIGLLWYIVAFHRPICLVLFEGAFVKTVCEHV